MPIKSKLPCDKEVCPTCNGNGKLYNESNLGFKVERNCKRCSGKGFITIKK